MEFKIKYASFLLITSILASCHTASRITIRNINKPTFNYQAHRGGRGLMPENTIPAMLAVMDNSKVTTLEMGSAITKDKQVVVSHDPILNPIITTKPDGTFIKANEVNENIIYQLDYKQLLKFDVGLKFHPRFPHKKN